MSRAASARLPLDEPIVRPTFRRERAAMRRGLMPVAGCDEAGRGPLAGPVVAAAVILDPNRIPKGLDDSKKLLSEQREKLYAKICATAEVAIAFGSTARIDRDNILRPRCGRWRGRWRRCRESRNSCSSTAATASRSSANARR